MTVPPKYAVPEFERRWLVANMSSVPGPLGDARLIEDRCIAETRLRLRRVTDAQGGVTTKLGKKYPAEAERATEAQIRAYEPPQFVGREITGDPHLTGFAIASSGSPAALLQRDS